MTTQAASSGAPKCCDARKTLRFDPAVAQAAELLDIALDAGGRLARKSLLPPAMSL